MAHTSAQVISGVPYQISEVGGRAPAQVDDFVGIAIVFTAHRGEVTIDVTGDGTAHDSGVRLHEKTGGAGKDIRVWLITHTEDGTFEACTETIF